MKLRSPIFHALAAIYEGSQAGRTGHGTRDVQPTFEELDDQVFEQTKRRLEGDIYEFAVQELRAFDGRLISIEWANRRARTTIHKVRFSPENENDLYALLKRPSPTEERRKWSTLFEQAAWWSVPAVHEAAWSAFCHRHRTDALTGRGWKPFHRNKRARAEKQLKAVAGLLGWHECCLLRTASARVTGNSKFFECCIPTLETLLAEISGGEVQSLRDLQILPNPTAVRFHGSIRLRLGNDIKDYKGLAGESALSETDIAAADAIETDAPRCVTIENATTFYELCRLGCRDLLILTSYPNSATVNFLRELPVQLPFYHWGDTDPWGFDVLRDLRRKTERTIKPLHMHIGTWAETLPPETRARRRLTSLDWEKLNKLLAHPILVDVREELRTMEASGSTGDFEQEGLLLRSSEFPYVNTA